MMDFAIMNEKEVLYFHTNDIFISYELYYITGERKFLIGFKKIAKTLEISSQNEFADLTIFLLDIYECLHKYYFDLCVKIGDRIPSNTYTSIAIIFILEKLKEAGGIDAKKIYKLKDGQFIYTCPLFFDNLIANIYHAEYYLNTGNLYQQQSLIGHLKKFLLQN